MLFEGKYREATALTNRTQVCKGAGSGHGQGANLPFGCFQTLGDLWIDFEKTSPYSDYYRDLNLETAMASVRYRQEGLNYTREYLVSAPDNVLLIRLKANKKGKLSFIASLSRPERFTLNTGDNQLLMSGSLLDGKGGEGMRYVVRLQAVTTGGTLTIKANRLMIKDASEAVLYLTAATDYLPQYPVYKGRDPVELTRTNLARALARTYGAVKEDHIKDYRRYFNRVSLRLAGGERRTPCPPMSGWSGSGRRATTTS